SPPATVEDAASESAIDAVPDFRADTLEGRSAVLILIDGWPAARAHIYGHSTDSTPFISQLAAESLLVETAHAASSFLGQSLSALLTGRYPTAGGTIGLIEAHPLDETATLPQQFLRAGYYTGIVTN